MVITPVTEQLSLKLKWGEWLKLKQLHRHKEIRNIQLPPGVILYDYLCFNAQATPKI